MRASAISTYSAGLEALEEALNRVRKSQLWRGRAGGTLEHDLSATFRVNEDTWTRASHWSFSFSQKIGATLASIYRKSRMLIMNMKFAVVEYRAIFRFIMQLLCFSIECKPG